GLFDVERSPMVRPSDSPLRITGDPARISVATHLLAAELYLATGDVHRAEGEVRQASLKLSSSNASDAAYTAILSAVIELLSGSGSARDRLKKLGVEMNDNESVHCAVPARLAAFLFWDGQIPPPAGINIHEARRWKSFSSLVPSSDSLDNESPVLPCLPAPSSSLLLFPTHTRESFKPETDSLDSLDPLSELLEELETLGGNAVAQEIDSRLTEQWVASTQEDISGLAVRDRNELAARVEEHDDYDMSVKDLAKLSLDGILNSIEQSKLTGQLDLRWSDQVIDAAMAQSVLEERILSRSGTIYFSDGRIIDAVLSDASPETDNISARQALAILVRLALSVGSGIRAEFRRNDDDDRQPALSVANNSAIILDILGLEDESLAQSDFANPPPAPAADGSYIAGSASDRTPEDAIFTRDIVALLAASSPGRLIDLLRRASCADSVELLYNQGVLFKCGRSNDPGPFELEIAPFRIRLYSASAPPESVHALVQIAASRLTAMPPDPATLLLATTQPGKIVAESDAMVQILRRAQAIVNAGDKNPPGKPILLTGEPGVGKGEVARYIHDISSRKGGSFHTMNMALLRREMCAANLFGYKKGAFTGATQDSPGLIDGAEGGTLLLDEVGEMDEHDQAQLLRVLQTSAYCRLGEQKERRANVRFILATNRDLQTHFRLDLRGRCLHIPIPPLRARKEDIRPLALKFAEERGVNLTEAGLLFLEEQLWPGNVRQLETVMDET
ncbi:MAG: sigma 54-interacting transcriptional regulator, partial [Blastocatellia bacterium]